MGCRNCVEIEQAFIRSSYKRAHLRDSNVFHRRISDKFYYQRKRLLDVASASACARRGWNEVRATLVASREPK
ncbi:hypothetical protein A0128_06475 [Leptospira tipperaryensis]|uniref:Uncharacterized protein n=1 Tax=Leptospira tipperaryensis TaxID=2564040 RepID=A0A1D7UV88_9LEPT|nr:hypothetical protein A0128_06475 [Leptospira tipperaryensis]